MLPRSRLGCTDLEDEDAPYAVRFGWDGPALNGIAGTSVSS